MDTLGDILAELLLKRQLLSGGWSFLGSRQSSVEATSLAVLALGLEAEDARRSGIAHLLAAQRVDGSWPAFLGDSEGSWATALALCTLNTTGDLAAAREKALRWLDAERGREGHWFWRWKFKTVDRNVRFDPDKYGWPWISGCVANVGARPNEVVSSVGIRQRGRRGAEQSSSVRQCRLLLATEPVLCGSYSSTRILQLCSTRHLRSGTTGLRLFAS